MPRHFFGDHSMFRVRHWADRTSGTKPYVHPYPYERMRVRENRGDLIALGKWDYAPNSQGLVAGSFVQKDLEVVCRLIQSGFDMPWLADLDYNNRKAKARNKALAKVDSKLVQATNFFEDWYERKQSYALLNRAGHEILAFLHNWRKPGYWKRNWGIAKTPSTLPEAWLTVQFGVKPLMGFVDNAFHNLAKPLPEVTIFETSGTNFSWAREHPVDPSFVFKKEDISYRYSLGCRVTGNPNPNLGLTKIVGLGQPFTTAFSVIPWGWAVDYFVNASELLSNLEVKHPGVHVGEWFTTEKWEIKAQQGQHHIDNLFRIQDADIINMRRTTNVSAPRYEATFSFPLLGSNQLANLFSAIALSMKKGK